MSNPQEPDPDQDKILAGEYALGLLSDAEAATFEARLASEPSLRALYAQWAKDFASLTDDIAPVTPPSRVGRAIEGRLFPERPKPLAARLGFGWLMGALTAVVLAVFVIGGFGSFTAGPTAPTNPAYLAQIAAEDGSLVVKAAYDSDKGQLFIDRQAGVPASGRAFELWLIAGSDAPVSLGVIPQAEQGVLQVPSTLQGVLEGAVLAISDEPLGGSTTGAPTGAVLAVGEITNV